MKFTTTFLLTVFLLSGTYLSAQFLPIVLEAETATLGADYEIKTEGSVTYIASKTDYNNAGFPGIADKVASFSVTFAEPGQYRLFARIRVGSGQYNDDSFYYGAGFGTKNPTNGDDWITCNGFVTPGFSNNDEIVDGEGSSSAEVWKWVSLSDYTGGDTPVLFEVSEDALVQTFEIGAREDGFDIDKIAFGQKGIYFTVSNLNNGEPGSDVPPEKPDLGPVLAENHDKFMGCSYGSGENTNEFLSLFNQITPENAGKWGSVERNRDQMNWSSLDAIYKLAKDYGLKYKHHVLVWGSQQPSWISSLPPEEQLEEIEEWFAAIANRYPDIDQVEVVNEPLAGHAPPDGSNSSHANYADALGGKGATGWDWIIKSFELARKYFPNSELLINEYGIINSTTNTQKYVEIIKLLHDRGLIDGICFQAHGFSMKGSVEVMKNNLDAMAAFELPIYPSELDIDGETDKKHLEGYMSYFKMFWEHPAVQGITLWGYNPDMWRAAQKAYLIENGEDRPAMKWLRAYLNNSFVPNESISISTTTGDSVIAEIGGSLQMEATVFPDSSTITTVTWKVDKAYIASIDENGKLTAKKEGTVKVTASSIEYGSTIKATKEITVTKAVSVPSLSGESKTKIYPNPSKDGLFTIDGLTDIDHVSIYDLSGKQIYYHDVNNQPSINILLNAQSGIYIVKMTKGFDVLYDKISIY